jgi:AraC-like DNA-binding protein
VPIAVEQLDRKSAYYWRSEEIALGAVTVALQSYGAEFRATAESVTDLYSLSIPNGDVTGEAVASGVAQTIDRRATLLHSPRGKSTFRLGTGYSGLQLLVRGEDMRAALADLLGYAPKEPLLFDPRLRLDGGLGASLERLLRFIVSESAHEVSLLTDPLAAARYGDAMLASILLGHGHNYRRRLERPEPSPGPRSIRRAAEYLEANASAPIRMAEVAAVAGVSVRALQTGFMKYRGCKPLEFLRACRLDRARALLIEGELSVSEVARAVGFAHLGRFSAHYRARFGVLPRRAREYR